MMRREKPFTGIYQDRAGKETGAPGSGDMTTTSISFTSKPIGTTVFGDRVGVASGCRYETMPTGYSTPFNETAPWSSNDPNWAKQTEHCAAMPTTAQLTQTALGDEIFAKSAFYEATRKEAELSAKVRGTESVLERNLKGDDALTRRNYADGVFPDGVDRYKMLKQEQ